MRWKRCDVINLIAKKINAKKYLEIGIQNPNQNFNIINIGYKLGVDKAPVVGHHDVLEISSDQFFSDIKGTEIKYDIIFIDADVTWKQSTIDVNNALNHITENGFVILHNVHPPRQYIQLEPKLPDMGRWCGGSWKTFATLRMTRSDLWMATIPDGMGCGLIRKGKQELYPIIDLTWIMFKAYKKELMNIITPKQLCEIDFNKI